MGRLNGEQVKQKYMMLCLRDGERCHVCGRKPPSVQLVVDHKNNDDSDQRENNLQLLCRRDNYNKNPRGPRCTYNASVIEQTKPQSKELDINLEAEPAFRHWLNEYIKKHTRISIEDAVTAGAEIAGVSPIATKRYLAKCTSLTGRFVIVEDPEINGRKCIELRPEELGISSNMVLLPKG